VPLHDPTDAPHRAPAGVELPVHTAFPSSSAHVCPALQVVLSPSVQTARHIGGLPTHQLPAEHARKSPLCCTPQGDPVPTIWSEHPHTPTPAVVVGKHPWHRPGWSGLQNEWHRPAMHGNPSLHGWLPSHAWQELALAVGPHTLSVDPVTVRHWNPVPHVWAMQPLHCPVPSVPPQQDRQYASSTVPMHTPHWQTLDSSQRLPTVPGASHAPCAVQL